MEKEKKKKMMMMAMEGMMEKGVLDDILRRLLEGKGGKQVQLSEAEIRQLCINACQIFLSQPNLLELHAPIRICATKYTGIIVWHHSNAPHMMCKDRNKKIAETNERNNQQEVSLDMKKLTSIRSAKPYPPSQYRPQVQEMVIFPTGKPIEPNNSA